jgi:hypothetical protein
VATQQIETPPTATPEQPARSDKRVPVVLAAALAVAAIGTVALTAGEHGTRPTAAAAPMPAPAPADGPALGSTYDSACGLSGGTSSAPASAPATDWQVSNGWYLPVTTAYGPGRRSTNGPWSCFARTPYGAVLAAWTIADRVNLARDFSAVVRQQVLPGTGQSSLLRHGQDHAQVMPPEPLGFRIDSYSNDAATVSFHTRQAAADMSCSVQVQWQGGAQNDWVLVAQPNGELFTVCAPLAAGAPQFVDWRPTA